MTTFHEIKFSLEPLNLSLELGLLLFQLLDYRRI
jgi:hypothetical protein